MRGPRVIRPGTSNRRSRGGWIEALRRSPAGRPRCRKAASLLAAFRHLGLPAGDLRKASIQTLRFRLFEVPGRMTRGQRKTWLHLPADWPWTPDLTGAWRSIKTLPIPT